MRAPLNRLLVFLALAGGGLGWDLYTKWWAFDLLGGEGNQTESWFVWLWGEDVFRIRTSFNHGALWGMGQGYSPVFAALSIIAALFVLYWLFIRGAARSWWLTVALAFIMAGTLGNLYDRLGLHGWQILDPVTRQPVIAYAVRDFLYFEIINWPIFNFADSFLVTGAIMLIIQSFWPEQEAESGRSGDSESDQQTLPLPTSPADSTTPRSASA